MDDDTDILRKADALLNRRRPAVARDFPILTDVVDQFSNGNSAAESIANDRNSELELIASMIDCQAMADQILQQLSPNIEALIADLIDSSRPQLQLKIEHSVERIAGEIAAAVTVDVLNLTRETIRTALITELSDLRQRLRGR